MAKKISDYWDKNAKNYDSSMRILGGPIPRMLELVGESSRGRARVLEVAAGTGIVTEVLARSVQEVIATDASVEMVTQLRRRLHRENLVQVRCVVADIYRLPYADQNFDGLVAANILHLLDDLPSAFAEMRRICQADARLIFPTFCHDERLLSKFISKILYWSGFPGSRGFSAESLIDLLSANGIQVTRFEVIDGMIPITFVEGKFV